MVILGKSLFLFPEPVKEIAEVCRAKNIPILYDGAHVLGLILGGQFQNPIEEGAHFINASTHKTFPGPQRGVILGNMRSEQEMKWWNSVDRGVMPGSSSNHHLHTLPGMLIAIREMAAHGQQYAAQTVANAKAFGQALADEGVNVEAQEFGFTESHQLALNVTSFGEAKAIARSLAERNNIITNYNLLPGDKDANKPSGLRIGVQEMTRYGMKEGDMQELAALVKAGLQGKVVKDEVVQLRSRFTEVHYC
jgi:glycine hydroxymethyltransferase